MKRTLKSVVLLGLAISLSGCNSVRNTLGLDHYQPDEFNIDENPPLSMPKDYNLRPPVDGKPLPNKPGVNAYTQQAAQALLGANARTTTTSDSSKNTQSLIERAHAGQTVDPHIRETVNKEAKDQEDDSVINRKLKEIKKNAASIYHQE